MKDIVNTLYMLANVANSEAAMSSKMKDQPSQAKAKQLYNKQAQLANVATQLQKTVKSIDDLKGFFGKSSLESLMAKVLQEARKALAPIKALNYPADKEKFVKGLNDSTLNQQMVRLNNILRVIKRNLELRDMALKNLLGVKEKDKRIRDEKISAYHKQVDQDKAIYEATRNKPEDLVVELDKANHAWAKILEEKYKIKNLPENAKPVLKTNPFANLLTSLFSGVSDLVKDIATNPQGGVTKPLKSFLGKLLPTAISLVAGLFKNFFGGATPSENDKKVDEFGKNLSKIFNNIGKAFTPGRENLSRSRPVSKVSPRQKSTSTGHEAKPADPQAAAAAADARIKTAKERGAPRFRMGRTPSPNNNS